MRRAAIWKACAVIIVIGAIAAAILTIGATSAKRVTVGYVATGITGLAVQVMRDQAIPEQHGVEIEYHPFANPSASNSAFVFGKFDVNLAAGANVVALARSQGHAIQYFFPTLFNSVSVIVSHDSEASSLTNLRGEKVGWYGLASGGGTAFYVLAHKDGLNVLKDFEMIQAKPPALWPLLERGEVKAIVIFEPFVSRMLATGKYRELIGPFWKEWQKITGNKMELSGLSASEEWLKDNAETARRLIAIWRDVALYIQNNPYEVLSKYNKFTKLESEVELMLAAQRIPGILATSWEGVVESIAAAQQILAHDAVVLKSIPEGILKIIE